MSFTTSCLESLPLEVTINVLSYMDANTLCSISQTNKVFYYVVCRDTFTDDILWRNIFLSELKLYVVQQSQSQHCDNVEESDKKKSFNTGSTIRKYLIMGTVPKAKRAVQFTDDQGNVMSLSDVYLHKREHISNVSVTGPGENNCHILRWKSVLSGHYKGIIALKLTDLLKDKDLRALYNDPVVVRYLDKYQHNLHKTIIGANVWDRFMKLPRSEFSTYRDK